MQCENIQAIALIYSLNKNFKAYCVLKKLRQFIGLSTVVMQLSMITCTTSISYCNLLTCNSELESKYMLNDLIG